MHRLQAPDVVHAIERAAGEHLGRPWKAREFVSLDDRASHPAGILRGDSPVGRDAHGRHVAPSRNGGLDVFAKFGAGDNAAIGLGRELDGLALLRDLGGAQTARPVANGVISVHDGCVLALEAVPERSTRERSSADWRSIGAALASLHAVTGTTFGLDVDGSFGPLTQLNGAVAEPEPTKIKRPGTTTEGSIAWSVRPTKSGFVFSVEIDKQIKLHGFPCCASFASDQSCRTIRTASSNELALRSCSEASRS